MNGIHGSTKYVCDRWASWDADATFGNGYITPGSPIDQHLSDTVVDINKTYTAAICLSDGTIKTDYGTFSNGFGSYALGIYCMKQEGSTGCVTVRLNTGNNIRWAALYEGSYDASTLPAYQPKGYAAELAECMRYYRRGVHTATIGKLYGAGGIFSIHFPKMRIDNPTINLINIISQGWGNVDKNNYTSGWGDTTGGEHYINFTSSVSDDIGKTIVIFYESSADL